MGERGLLVKFGTHEHMLALQRDGLLYMNPLPYFWKIENDDQRGDPYDGVDELRRGPRAEFLVDGTSHPYELLDWELKKLPPEPEEINLFCMYALRPDAGSFPADNANLEFGEYALIITDPPTFINRVDSRLRDLGVKEARGGLVEYVPDDYVGDVGLLRKLQQYSHQSEWRVVCNGGPGGPREIELGSLEDISVLVQSSELNAYVIANWDHLFGPPGPPVV